MLSLCSGELLAFKWMLNILYVWCLLLCKKSFHLSNPHQLSELLCLHTQLWFHIRCTRLSLLNPHLSWHTGSAFSEWSQARNFQAGWPYPTAYLAKQKSFSWICLSTCSLPSTVTWCRYNFTISCDQKTTLNVSRCRTLIHCLSSHSPLSFGLSPSPSHGSHQMQNFHQSCPASQTTPHLMMACSKLCVKLRVCEELQHDMLTLVDGTDICIGLLLNFCLLLKKLH